MRRKNALEYIMMALFIMCMPLSLSAALEYASVGTQRPFLLQGAWMLSLVLLSLGIFVGIRFLNKISPRMTEKKKTRIAFIACAVLFVAGLVLRILVIEGIHVAPASDYETYYRIAGELLNDTMLTAEGRLDRRYVAMYPHTIGFPMLILLPAFRIFGQSVRVAQYANLVCSMVSLLLCTHIGKRLAGRLGAVLAMLMMALWPSHILYANMVATEQSFTMLVLAAADLMLGTLDRDEHSLYARSPGKVVGLLILTGVTLALAGAIRPMAILLLASFVVVQLMQNGDPEGKVAVDGARYALCRGWLCVIIVVIPYLFTQAIISRAITDTIVEEPASGLTASGYNLMVGVNVKSEGRWNQEDSDFFGGKYDELGNANDAHAACMQVAIQRISSEPENVLNLLVFKFRDLWQTDDFGIDWNLQWTDHQGTLTPELKSTLEAIRPTGRLLYMAVLLYALVAAVVAWRGERAPKPMVMVSMIFFLGTALSHMLLETQVRYHYNMLPFLMLLATVGIVSWRQKLATEPAVRVIYKETAADANPAAEHEDNTHFDMRSALLAGNIIMTVTEAYEHDVTFNNPAAAAAAQANPEPAETPEEPDLMAEFLAETAGEAEPVPEVPEEAVEPDAEPEPEPVTIEDEPAPEEPTPAPVAHPIVTPAPVVVPAAEIPEEIAEPLPATFSGPILRRQQPVEAPVAEPEPIPAPVVPPVPAAPISKTPIRVPKAAPAKAPARPIPVARPAAKAPVKVPKPAARSARDTLQTRQDRRTALRERLASQSEPRRRSR